ncbi:DUF86 domain-containing protein [Salinicoccus hispanicus]|uniref:DUF86 domain-containing protein n=1 Tax=Salinicoccus hispanicus TaxID=157225 RepID=A0A6N8U326_9STAP|nr:DUF86 domain-containing protein [Salinicoccus hispanicus]MXQ50805.1 DUF86 domain-containing protein [Salinicoccus hispanicus]
MYFVDKDVLIERLDYIELLTEAFEERDGLALERSCHMLIEAVVDVGNMIIDAFILRDPGSYKDVMDIMENEGVIPESDNRHFQTTFKWRSELTRNYTKLDHEEMKINFLEHLSAYQDYRRNVFSFFENEGQAITAFRGDQHEV